MNGTERLSIGSFVELLWTFWNRRVSLPALELAKKHDIKTLA
jgi:hypothetical protein